MPQQSYFLRGGTMNLPQLSFGQYQLVFNMLSLAVAAMLASMVFFILARERLSPKYRLSMIVSALVVGIAAYHYWRIFGSFSAAYKLSGGVYVATGKPFNDAYRYVDWLLTVPLLMVELIAVLQLPKKQSGPMLSKLVIAAAAMIALGYPGEITSNNTTRAIWGTLSTIPFLYIVYVLWAQLGQSLKAQSARVQVLMRNTQLLILATWGFYPIAYMMPMFGISGASATVGLQVGYSIADITAKCGYGVMIFAIARAKMAAEAPEGEAALEAAPAKA